MAITAAELRERMRQGLVWTAVFVLGSGLMSFAVDVGLFHLRVATNRNAYGSVIVRRTYAVLQKNGKTEYIVDPPAPENCVNALFPHSGMQPCWYLRWHPEQRIDI